MRVVVIGAGAFGGWTALKLRERGVDVLLIDAWGPGNSRASSGGETRVIRHSYDERANVDLAARSLSQWRHYDRRWKTRLFRQTGVLFVTAGSDYLDKARSHLADAGVKHSIETPEAASSRIPGMATDDLRWGIFEPGSGYLLARRACRTVVSVFTENGGQYRQGAVRAPDDSNGSLLSVRTADGDELTADAFVFACGPWLPALFPTLLGEIVRPTRQEVFYFGTPPGARSLEDDCMPVWADLGDEFWYGIPGNESRGFKVANDSHGPDIEPTSADRQPSPARLQASRDYLARRFPAMADAPVLEARVCQYSNTPDGQFVFDQHPLLDNVWLLGGGSGHGFKHGPALGELVASAVVDGQATATEFALDRFSGGDPVTSG